MKESKGDKNLNPQNDKEEQNQQSKADQDMQAQFDVDGGDILFEMAQKI